MNTTYNSLLSIVTLNFIYFASVTAKSSIQLAFVSPEAFIEPFNI